MGLRAIALRDETVEALQAVMNKANEIQDDVEASLSDVIDAALLIAEAGPLEVLEERTVHIAAEN